MSYLDENYREQIRQSVRESIERNINGEQQMDESIALGLASIAALGGAWAWTRNFARRVMAEKHLRQFIDTYDTEKLIERQVPETLRRFNLVANLTDLENIEKRFDALMSQVSALSNYVDEYVNTIPYSNVSSRVLAIDPNKQKRVIRSNLKDFVTMSKNAFTIEMNSKRDALLS